MTDNMQIWERVEATDPKYTKKITGKKFNGTSPNPIYLARKATEVFGPIGSGWGHTELSHEIIETPKREDGNCGKIWVCHVELWYMLDGAKCTLSQYGQTEMVYWSDSGNKWIIDDEAPKKSRTDAVTKCLSLLGFSADIWLGYYDSKEYVNQVGEQIEAERKAEDAEKSHALALKQLESTLKSAGCEDANDKTAVVQYVTGTQYGFAWVEANHGWPHKVQTKIQEVCKRDGIKPVDILLAAKGQTA